MKNPEQPLSINQPSHPKDGAIQGMGEFLTSGGANGMASLTLPLKVTSGSRTAPALSLIYNSGNGNSAFGMGWQCTPDAIRLRTTHGIPRYKDRDTFLNAEGEVLNIALNDEGQPDVRSTDQLTNVRLGANWRVTRYQPRIVSNFSRLEYWQPEQNNDDRPFWVQMDANGQINLFGKNTHARIADPTNDRHIAQWLLEETLTPTGEHIYYHYRAEDENFCGEAEISQHPNASAQRYLVQVNYGNITPQTGLFALEKNLPDDEQWLFHLVFDYGERSSSPVILPDFTPDGEGWTVRPDCFSQFNYGFEIRTRRLCQQILTYHRLQALAGADTTGEVPVLVSRTILDMQHNKTLSTLTTIQQSGLQENEKPLLLPPLSLAYNTFPLPISSNWQAMTSLGKFNHFQPWQFIDLYGEGIPGILYQDQGAWWYRAPLRDTTQDNPDAITYSLPEQLPLIPSQQQNAALLDINGDGKLDWLITSNNLHGYHTLAPDGQWSPLIPITALPSEFFHPRAQQADITGAGLPDLVMIGPRSVRLFANQRTDWAPAEETVLPDGITLPYPGADAKKLVAFADMLGSGQSHLVEISEQSVRCWPNRGYGDFAAPITLDGFRPPAADFNPNRIWLVDIDGSGTTDIIYATSTSLLLFINESGNHFAEPVTIPLPAGVLFDHTCQLHIADTQGLGVSSIILILPHMKPAHWRLDLTNNKPWLLNTINNNMGSITTLSYRSSAQFWLDEKQTYPSSERAVSHLPFPLHLLCRTETIDEISGNHLTATYSYAHGGWDGEEREIRNFGRVTQTDTDEKARGTATTHNGTFPKRTISWFATGIDAIDKRLPTEYWQGDSAAWAPFTPRFSRYDSEQQKDIAITPTDKERYWLQRALKGALLHQEIYGDDGTPYASLPYLMSEHRPQVRKILSADDQFPCAWVSEIETRSYNYERIAVDPQCDQQIILAFDHWGSPTDSITIAYPRRPQPQTSPYPDTLPDTLFASSYDEQQQILHLTRQRQRWHHLTGDDCFLLKLPDITRNDIWEYEADQTPEQGITLEELEKANSLIGPGTPYLRQGYQRIAWVGDDTPDWPPLKAYTETAEQDEQTLAAFDEILTEQEITGYLKKTGYIQVTPPLPLNDKETNFWVIRNGYSEYGDHQQFFRPLLQQETLLAAGAKITWDPHYAMVAEIENPGNLRTQATYDYRFMLPTHIIDENDNHHQFIFDTLGRLSHSRFWGTEENIPQGYDKDIPFTVPDSIEAALALNTPIPVAQFIIYNPLSWMADSDERLPPHLLVITTDRYDHDTQQQQRQTITFSDGFGRPLQTGTRQAPGDAWQRGDDGRLATDSSGNLIIVQTDNRWAISGRNEYDNKGQPVRRYQPYFLDNWQYICDDSARQDLWADTYYYDAINREYQVITAKGYLRRHLYTPWFTVNEDENDTAE
ncbi:hypothetical protein Xvie_03595 [Xenorhabdus vietnamensis]|uniref:Virulence protein n=1 Tax=Xenorhabdus vietnamensis TaxID=351656 RepID=A0A1Y2S9H9_9GAMM|nr:SpvB/TcaC N-terminal domain-containing protein [Xenorhabdus vietnamensis]OTA14566.1 hypothetical protein Xvie_03595 [Xenorhabdus vietnamensis]